MSEYNGSFIRIDILVLIAIGILEAWKMSIPWYVGFATALVAIALSTLGIIPIFGQVVYWFGMKYIMMNVIGIWMPILFYVGFAMTILVSILVGFILLILIGGGNIKNITLQVLTQ